jgi:hypothetical protein
MSDRQSNVREADAKLAEIMLSARAKSTDGREAIQGLQEDIVAALNDPKYGLDTKDGELQFLKFLREKAEAANRLVDDGKLTSEDQAKLALALKDFYRAGSSGGPDSQGPRPGEPAPGTSPGATPPADPGSPRSPRSLQRGRPRSKTWRTKQRTYLRRALRTDLVRQPTEELAVKALREHADRIPDI